MCRSWQGKAVAVVVLVATGCGGQASKNHGSPSASPLEVSSPETSTVAASAAPRPPARPTPTLVPFFQKLAANGGPTMLNLSNVFPGAVCAAAVSAPDPSNSKRTITFTQRDLPQDLRQKVADPRGKVSWTIDSAPKALSAANSATWNADCRLYDSRQPDFLVYHSSITFPPP